VEHALLRDLLERREICGNAVPRRPLAPKGVGVPVRYLPCPTCSALMNRHNFGGTSGVIVDVCGRHGVWFDAGELPRVLTFVESGGLAESRRRERQEAESRSRAMHAAAADAAKEQNADGPHVVLPGGAALGYSKPPAWESGLWEDAREAVTTLLHDLGSRLGKR
jgi:Zn-finger nucleic acid-binding protein